MDAIKGIVTKVASRKLAMTKRYRHADKERYDAAIGALDVEPVALFVCHVVIS